MRVLRRAALSSALQAGVRPRLPPPVPLRTVAPAPAAARQMRWLTPAVEDVIIEAGPKNTQEVLQDKSLPVLVDFYSKYDKYQSSLDKAVMAANANGLVLRLLRVNATQPFGQSMADFFQMQTVPTTYALWNGQLLDSLVGGAPPDVVEKFINKFMVYTGKVKEQSPAEAEEPSSGSDMSSKLVTARARYRSGKFGEAKQLYQEALQTAVDTAAEEKKNRKDAPKKRDQKVELTTAQQTAPKAIVGLAVIAQAEGDAAEATNLVMRVKKEHTVALKELKDVQQAIAQVEMLVAAQFGHRPSAQYQDLATAAEGTDDEPKVRLQLGAALFLEGKHADAVNVWLATLKKHRKWNDDAAKRCLVAAFSLLGGKNEISVAGRKRMMAYVF